MKCIQIRNDRAYLPRTTSAYSLVTALAVTIVSPLGARPHPPGPNALFNIRRYLISGRYIIPSGFTSTSSGGIACSRTSAASLEKGSVDRPWKEWAQSTCLVFSSRITGWSSRPFWRSWVVALGGTCEVDTIRQKFGTGSAALLIRPTYLCSG